MLLHEMTWPEVKAAVERNAALVLPAGATEQHGPHLPVGTDTLLPVELLLRAAERIDLLIAPPLHHGYKSRPLSGGGQGSSARPHCAARRSPMRRATSSASICVMASAASSS